MIKFVSFLPTVTVLLIASNVTISEDTTSEGRTVYDQRQTGKYNIHVSIKDVSIIELDRNDFREQTNSDPDYYYDDNDYTIKPLLSLFQSFNTSKPSATTEKIEIGFLGSSYYNYTSTTIPPTKDDSSEKQSTESSMPTTKKPSNVIILGSDIVHVPSNISMLHENGGQIPVQIVMEPILHPKYKTGQQQAAHKSVRGKGRPSSFRFVGAGSRNANLKAARSTDDEAHQQHKPKFSILEKLLGLLTPPNDHDEEE